MTFEINGKEYMLIAVGGMVDFIMKTADGTAVRHSMSEDIAKTMLSINAEHTDECPGFDVCTTQEGNKFFFPAVEVVKTEPAPKKSKRGKDNET